MTRVQEIEADWENAGCPEGDEAVLLREIERLRAMYQVHYKAREKAEAEVQLLRDTLVTDASGRLRKLWELLEHCQKAEAALAQAEKRIKELEEAPEQAYKEGWDDALDCIVADPASPYPNKAQQNNGWLESDACLALQGEEG